MTSAPIKLTSLALILWLWGQPALGADCTGPNKGCVAVDSWELQLGIGLGLRTNPLQNGDNIPLVLVPQFRYYGERFFIDTLDIGYTLVDDPRLMVNALLTPGRDGLYFFEDGWRNLVLDGGLGSFYSPPREPMLGSDQELYQPQGPTDDRSANESPTPMQGTASPSLDHLHERHVAGMAGLEVSSSLGALEWQAQLLTDVTGVHEGQELRLAVGYRHRIGSHQLGITGGFSWKSADLLEYYYGVTNDEANDLLPAYRPGDGTTPFVRFDWSKPVNDRWRWRGGIQYEHLSRAVRDSPIIKDDQVIQVFLGGVYHF